MMADWRDGLIPIGQNSAPNDGAALADPAADNWRSGLIPIGGGNDTTAPSQSSWMPQPTDDERFLKRMQEAGRIQNPESAAYAPTALRNVMRDRMGLASEYDANEMAGRDNRLRQRLKLDGYDDAEIDDMPANVWEAHRQANETDPRERQVNFATNELEDRLALSGFEQPEHQKEWPKEMTSGADNLGEPLSVTAMKALTKKKYAPSDESVIQRVGKPLPEVSTTDAFKELESLRTEAYQRAQRGKLMDPEFLPKLNAIERLKSELEAKYPEFAAEKGYKSFDAETTKWLKRSANANEDQFNRDVAETRKNWNAGIGGDFSGSEAGGLAVGIGTGSRSLAATAARGIGATINATGAPGINVIGDALSRISDRLQYGNRVLNAAQQQAVKEQNYGTIRQFLGENLPDNASSLYQAAALSPAGMGGMTLGFGALAANDAYYEAKQQGLSESEAVKHATVDGGLEMVFMAAFNKLGKMIPGLEGVESYFVPAAEKMVKDGALKQTKRFLRRMAGEELEENFTSISQAINQAMNLPQSKGQDQWFDPKKEGFDSFYDSPMMRTVRKTTGQTALMMGIGETGHQAIRVFAADPSRTNYQKLPREIRELHHLPVDSGVRQRAKVAKDIEVELDLFTESQATSPALQPEPPIGEGVIPDGQEVPEVRQEQLQVRKGLLNPDAVAADGAAADDGFSLDEIMGLMPRAEGANEGTEADAGVAQDGTQPTPVISPAVSQESPIENAPTTSGMQSDAVAEPAADVQPASSLPAAVVEAAPVDAPVSAPASGRSDADRREFRNGVLEGRQPEFDADNHREWQGSDEYVAAIAKTPRLAAMSRVVDREAEEWLKNNPDDESGPPMTRKERELDRAIVRVIELSGLQVSDGVKRHLGMPLKKSPPPSVAAQPSSAVEQSASGVPGATLQKQPWEMTRAEYDSNKTNSFGSHRNEVRNAVDKGLPVPQSVRDEYRTDFAQMWELTLDEFKDKWRYDPSEGSKAKYDAVKAAEHRFMVANAIEKGMNVPANVLAEYPALQAGAIPSDAAGVQASPPASASKAASSVAESSSGVDNVGPQAKAQSDQSASQRGDQQVRDSREVVRKRERRAAKLKPDEQAVSKSVDETIKRAERVAEQHAGSPHGEELKAVVEAEKRNRDAAVIGTETTIKAPGMGEIPARFGLLDISQVIASHDFTNGQANSASNVANGRYPSDLQPRNYDAGSDNYEKVVTNARQFDERELLADSAYATVGPSVVTPQGIVLNGNGRTMTLQLARHIGKGERYQQALRERLSLYGLTEADAAGMEFPVLVRIVDFDATSPQAKQFAEVGNISVTQAQSPAETARKLSSLLPANIVKLLRLEGEETFAEAINGKRFLDALRESWPPSERANYFESDGTLTAAGKDIVRNTLLQRIAPLKTLEQLTDAQSNMLASAIPQILTLQEQHPDLNVAPQLIEAMAFRNQHDTQSMAHVELALREQDLFTKTRPELSDGAKSLMPWLFENQNKATALREAAKRVLSKVTPQKGLALFEQEPDTSTAAEKISDAFGHFKDGRLDTPLKLIDGATFGESTTKSLPESAEPRSSAKGRSGDSNPVLATAGIEPTLASTDSSAARTKESDRKDDSTKEPSNAVPADQSVQAVEKPAAASAEDARTKDAAAVASDQAGKDVQRSDGPQVSAEPTLADRIAAWPDEAVRDAAALALKELAVSEANASDKSMTKADRAEAERRAKAIQQSLEDVFVPAIPDEPTVRDRPSKARTKPPKSLSEAAKAFLVENQANIQEAAENAAGKLQRYGNEPFINDIVSEVNLAAGTGFKSFDAKKGNARQWLFTIASTRAVSLLRKAGNEHKYDMAAGLDKMTDDEKAGAKPKERPADTQAARDEFDAAAKAIHKRWTDPDKLNDFTEIVKDIGQLTYLATRAKMYEFRDYIRELAKHIDPALLRKYATEIETLWSNMAETERGKRFGLSKSEPVGLVLDEQSAESQSTGSTAEEFGDQPVAINEPPSETGTTAAEMLAPGADFVSTQNKYAAKVREELGMPERGPVDLEGHTWDDLNKQASEFSPDHAVNLLAELGDKEKPARAVSDLENFILLRYLRGLQNQRLAAVGEIADARKKGEASREALAQATLTALDQQLKSFVAITEAIGTPAGRLLAARKAFLAMDYSIPKLEYDIEQAQQRPMTPKEKTELADLQAKYEALKKHAEDVEAKYAEQQAQAAIAQAITSQVAEQKNPASVRKQKASVRFSAAFNIFSKEIATAHSFGSFSPEAFSAAVEMVKASVELGVATVQDFVDSVAKRVGKALTPEVDAGLRKAWSHVEAEAKSPKKLDFDPQNSNSLRRAAQEIMREHIAKGVTSRDALMDAVHEELKQYLPEITRREAMMAMSGYGDIRPATNDPIELVRQDVNGQIQAVLKLEDMSHGVAPLHSGQQRNPQSQEKRRLEQEVNEAKRKGGFVTLDPETQLKSTLQARETWLRHRMEDLRFEISKGTRTVKTKTPTPTSPAIEALQAEYELLKAEHEAVFGKRELTDKQKLEIATKHAAKNEAFWADQLAKAQKGEFPAGEAKKPPITSPELEAIRAKTKAAQAEFKRLDDAAHPERKEDARYARAKANVAHWQQRLQDAQNGLFQPRHPKAEDSTGVTLLKSLAAYSRAQAKELDDAAHPERSEQLLNDRYLTSLLRQKLAIESKIASGDIAVKPKVERKLTPEVVQARHDREQAKAKLDEIREKARLEGRGTVEKLKDVFAGTWDVTRDLMTTGEASFLLRQGLLYAAGHPLKFLRATAKSFAVFSKWNNERELFQVNEEIQERPNAKSGLYARGKVPFSDSLGKKTGAEELLIGKWAERIPLLGRIIKRNAMAGDAFLNIARADMFDAMASSWSSDPNSVTTAESRVFGSAAGVFTGKGNTGDLATSVKWFNRVFFSFPFTLSRFQIVLGQPLLMKGSTLRTQKAVATEYVRAAIGLFVFYKAIQFALSAAGGDDDEEPVLEGNPLSSDFGKWRIGRTRLDPLAGIQQVAVLLARQGFNQKKTAAGVTVPLGGMGGRVDDARDVINNFWWSKVHPTPSLYFNLRTGRDLGGGLVTADDVPKSMIPMSYPGMAEAVKETGLPRGLILDALAFTGAGLNTYGMTTKEMNQAVAMKASDTMIAEDRTRSETGAMKGKLKSEYTGQHLEDAKQNDAVIKSAREVLMQRTKTDDERQELLYKAWMADPSHNRKLTKAYWDSLRRLNAAAEQSRQRQPGK